MTLRELMTAMFTQTSVSIEVPRYYGCKLVGVPVEIRYRSGPRWLVKVRKDDMNIEYYEYDLSTSPTSDPLDAELR
jgi:hypothetical protein